MNHRRSGVRTLICGASILTITALAGQAMAQTSAPGEETVDEVVALARPDGYANEQTARARPEGPGSSTPMITGSTVTGGLP